ncbi:MAG: UPF0755 protein [Parcubacteria bacterium C7867-005]|nr:MAG: UPF0755 protein [Parcubacteria bacterium C7867-005]
MDNPIFRISKSILLRIDEWIKNKNLTNLHVGLGSIIFLLVLIFILIVRAPSGFPQNSIITVEEGSGLYGLALELKEDKVIRSAFGFKTFAIILGGEREMKAGEYYLSKPQGSLTLAWRILHGMRGLDTVRITIPEGFTKTKISKLFDDRFSKFDHQYFLNNAREGYLFPDTYFIETGATASSTINLLVNNFENKLEPLVEDIKQSKKSEKEIIIMASILESEAQNKVDREIVSGILWKRIGIKMALQVDASIGYITGKTSKELTIDDLSIDSPYNTYKYRGLPPEPISNPGLESIIAALNPKTSDYFYFLTDDDGVMHYAKTFDEHKQNKAKYLRN